MSEYIYGTDPPPTPDPRGDALALYEYAKARGRGDVDAGVVQIVGHWLATDVAPADWYRRRDITVWPRIVDALVMGEALALEDARRRAGRLAVLATFHAANLYQERCDREQAARDLVAEAFEDAFETARARRLASVA